MIDKEIFDQVLPIPDFEELRDAEIEKLRTLECRSTYGDKSALSGALCGCWGWESTSSYLIGCGTGCMENLDRNTGDLKKEKADH